ncbi:MAG: hypothetical protein RMK29_06190 [Myxococcales bacterium]|nr:hypothetical protein [Myxococcota bacterium]MDW8281281.1 hypothetical protein [Myxococcales bacterium]
MLLLLALGGGCGVSAEDISRWKQTQKGPERLRAALADAHLRSELRAQAALALVDIGRCDEAAAVLREVEEPARRAILRLAMPQLVARLQEGPADRVPTEAQIRAKDALFVLRLLGAPEERKLADEALTAWVVADLSGRLSAGSIGSERILLDIGARAQGALLAVLSRASLGSPNLLPAASLLGRLGDRESRRRAAEQIMGLLRPVLSQGQSSGVEEGMRALGALRAPEAARFLAALAERGPVPLRQRAFAALGAAGDPTALELALQVAWDRREPGGVREAAFSYLERLGEIAVDGLCRIIADPKEGGERGQLARYRAVEAALAAGGAAAVGRVLKALPEEGTYDREDFVAFVVRQLTALGPTARPYVRTALQSQSWVARAAALMALGEAGEPQDAEAMAAHFGDPARLRGRGWTETTVGELARRQAERLRSKR